VTKQPKKARKPEDNMPEDWVAGMELIEQAIVAAKGET